MEELQAFVTDKKFLAGLIIGFALGALHHYFGLLFSYILNIQYYERRNLIRVLQKNHLQTVSKWL